LRLKINVGLFAELICKTLVSQAIKKPLSANNGFFHTKKCLNVKAEMHYVAIFNNLAVVPYSMCSHSSANGDTNGSQQENRGHKKR